MPQEAEEEVEDMDLHNFEGNATFFEPYESFPMRKGLSAPWEPEEEVQDMDLHNFEGNATFFEPQENFPMKKGLPKTAKELWNWLESHNSKRRTRRKKMMKARNERRMIKFSYEENKNERETLGKKHGMYKLGGLVIM